ncbi:MAG: family 20 glycosylhydrolase [Muribaculaceae bacterium]|nr:family 20 glycosylhydrolase [Muribaculaceae bacterium]
MRKIILSLLLIVSYVFSIRASEEHLLPKPQIANFSNSEKFAIFYEVKLMLPTITENEPAVDKQLHTLVKTYGGTICNRSEREIVVNLVDEVKGAEFQDEAYNLVVSNSKITINAKTLRGAYWAVQTLWQLAEGMNGEIPACEITDWPSFRIRGYMHDVGRSYIEFEELKNEIIKMSRFKVNTFHWHLTDNQGWRLESRVYPQLNADSSYTRLHGRYYTISQAKELVKLANQHGVTIIPEIDMPGHSLAYRKAMGHSMLTSEGVAEMREIMTEACQTFEGTEWMHIGTDELRDEDRGTLDWTDFVPVMVSHIRAQGKKVVSWNPGYHYSSSEIDMTQMWSYAGKPTEGVPTIDCRFHYTNHFDNFADIVSLYHSTIARQTEGSDQYAGVILAFWNDRLLSDDKEIISQNQVWASTLAMAERAWLGGGKGYFDEIGVRTQADDYEYKDWEKRFLYHKANYLKGEPIPYVKQTNIRWNITDAFPNNGELTASFPPENAIAESYSYNGQTYNVKQAVGGSVYLRHVWGTLVPAFYSAPQENHTAYAYTYVYSPKEQTVGAMIEFQNYSRSEKDLPAPQGAWDYKGSRIWLNDVEISAPVWENTHTEKSNEITLKNENMVSRTPIPVQLNKGWNKVFIKLPVGTFNTHQVRLVKWMYAFVFTTLNGQDAIEALIYSPDRRIIP